MTDLLLIPVADAIPALEANCERWPDDGSPVSAEEVRESREMAARFLPATRALVRYATAVHGTPAATLAEVRDRAHGLTEADADLTLRDILSRHRAAAAVRCNPQTGERLASKTLATYEAHERTLLGLLDPMTPAADLTKGDVAGLIEALRRRGLAERSIYEVVAYLKRCYQWAVQERELLARNPIEGARNASRVSRPSAYAPEESELLLVQFNQLSDRA